MIYSSWDIEQNILKLVILCHFFTPLKPLKIKILKKWKTHLVISSFYTCVPKISIIWCTVLEIRSETDRIFCHLGYLFPFHPPSLPKWSRKLKFWKKWKKCLEILSFYTYMCTVNEDHMIYGFWNIMCDRQKFLSFWAKLENQNFNIEKKYLEILSFYTFEP